MLGSLIYTLPQKKCNLQEPEFLLGRSVYQLKPMEKTGNFIMMYRDTL